MFTYNCKKCDYHTNDKRNITRHNESLKHRNKVNNIVKINKCNKCNKTYNSYNSLWRHQEKFCNNNIKIQYNNDDRLSQLCNTVDNLMKIVVANSETVKISSETTNNSVKQTGDAIQQTRNAIQQTGKAMNILSYAIKHLNKAPPVKKLNNSDTIKMLTYDNKNKSDIGKDIIYYFNKNTLDVYFGDMILHVYKKKDPQEQPLWASDTSRLTFIIRELVGSGEDANVEWIKDKNGIRFTKYIIEPLLDKAKIIMNNFANCCTEKFKVIKSIDDGMILLKDSESATKIIEQITLGKLHIDVLRYISPYFCFELSY